MNKSTPIQKRDLTLSERHAKTGTHRSEKSLALSVLLHGALVAGLVGVSFYAGKTPKPRRVYNVNFGGGVQLAAAEIAKETTEQLQPSAAEPEERAFELADGGWNKVAVPIRPEPLREEHLEVSPAESFAEQLLDPDFLGPEAAYSPLQPVVVQPAPVPDAAPESDEPTIEPEDEPHTPNRIEGKDADYPRLSLRLKEKGDVELRLTLDEEGRVRGVELVKGSGFARLDEAAMSAAPKWRFDLTPPAGFAAEDVLRTFVHVVHFKLNK